MRDIDNSQDVISMDDVTERFAELRDERASLVEERDEAKEELDAMDTETDLGEYEEAAKRFKAAEEALEVFDSEDNEDAEELATLTALLDETRGYGGDHQFEGDWYPGSLIRESYFTDYCEQLVKDIGDLPDETPGYLAIDWGKTADNLRVDYSEVEYDGITYLYR
jgi:hypothetical protein